MIVHTHIIPVDIYMRQCVYKRQMYLNIDIYLYDIYLLYTCIYVRSNPYIPLYRLVDEDNSRLQLVELPRVQLRFVPGPDPINGKGFRLFSKEFGGESVAF